jgi:hypothetical protein
VGKDAESTPAEPSEALRRLKLNHKDDRPLWDYVAQLLGFDSYSTASASGVLIVCLNTKMCHPQQNTVHMYGQNTRITIHTCKIYYIILFWAELATCMFYDPNRRRGVNHLGFHPTNIDAFTASNQFKPFMTMALNQLDEAGSHLKQQEQYTWRSPGSSFQPRVVCVTCCNKGRHRSVSASQVLQEVMQSVFKAHVFHVFQICIGLV